MGTVKRFEDLQVWQKARILVREIYRSTADGRFARDFVLRDQVRRAALSIMLNVAEGFGRRTDAEFVHFLVVARASAAEVQSVLYVCLDVGYLEPSVFHRWYGLCEEISKMCLALGQYLHPPR